MAEKYIEIAPNIDNIEVSDNEINTPWNGGITYKADLKECRKMYGDEELKKAFQTYIALVCRPWQLELFMNHALKIEDKVI